MIPVPVAHIVEASQDHHGNAAWTVTFKCPACQTETRMITNEWVHKGYPKRDDNHYVAWDLRCTGCGQWARAWKEQKLFRRYCFGRYDTLRRLVGPLMWEVQP